jgi:SAM-dependent methyltransferase
MFDMTSINQFREMANPWLINYIGIVNSFPAQQLQAGFDYCEVGCGNGLTLNILAAANPRGRFYGIDHDPARIEKARDLARETGLKNVQYHTGDPSSLPQLDLPDLNFIVLGNFFSRIAPPVRTVICDFIARKLKLGGMVALSYHTLQGCSLIAPIRDFICTLMQEGEGDIPARIGRALTDLDELRRSGAPFFQINTLAGMILDSLKQIDPSLLFEEFIATYWEPLNYNTAAAYMDRVGVTFAGTFPVALNYIDMSTTKESQEYFRKLHRRETLEMGRDLLNMTIVRNDIYCKGQAGLGEDDRKMFGAMCVGSFFRAGDFRFKIPLMTGSTIDLEGPLYAKLVPLIARRSSTFEEILAHDDLGSEDPRAVLSAIQLLIATDQAKPYAQPSTDNGSGGSLFSLSMFNRELLLKELPSREVIPLASWTAGSGVLFSRKDALALLSLSEGGVEGAEAWAGLWAVRNRALMDDGGPTISEAIAMAAAQPDYWQLLGIGEPPL